MTSPKALFRGKFNYSGQIFEEWVRATSPKQAYLLLTARLPMQLGRRSAHDLRKYFDGTKRNLEIWSISEDGKSSLDVTLEALGREEKKDV